MGLISDMFPEFSQNLDEYFKGGGQLLEKPTTSFIRGMGSASTGMVDLFSLPQTLLGRQDPRSIKGSTAWADERNLLPPKQKADSMLGQVGLDTLEALGGLGVPSITGSLMKRIQPNNIPASTNAGRDIPANAGQIARDEVKMDQAAKLRSNPKFAQRVADFELDQGNTAGRVFDNFKMSINRTAEDNIALGERIKDNFNTWFDNVKSTYKSRNDMNYEAAIGVPAANLPIPTSRRAMDIADNFIRENLTANTPDAFREAMMDMQRRVTQATLTPGTLKGLHQARQEANQVYRPNVMDPGPFKNVDKGSMSRLEAVYKAALDARLEDTVNAGGDIGTAATELRRANDVFERTTNKLKKIQNEAMNKFIGNRDGQDLTPEQVYNKILKLEPKERKFFTSVANGVDPETVGLVRRAMYDDLFDAGKRIGYADNESAFDIQAFLNKYDQVKNKTPEMLDWVLGKDPAVREKFGNLIDQARQAVSSSKSIQEASSADARNMVAGAAANVTGSPGVGRIAYAGMDVIANMFKDKEKLYSEIFLNPSGKLPSAVPATRQGQGTALGMAGEVAKDVNEARVTNIDSMGPAPTDVMPPTSPPQPPQGDNWSVDASDLQWEPTAPPEPSGDVDPEDLKW